jgi:Uncharacterized conserved protein
MPNNLTAFNEHNPKDGIYATIPKATVNKYQNKLPKALIDIWEKEGLSSYKDGFFWLVNPDEYKEIIYQFIPNEDTLHVLIRTAFGGLIYLNEQAKKQKNNSQEKYNYLCPIYLQVTPLTSDFTALMNGWLTTEDIYIPLMLYEVFRTAKKRLPSLQSDQCFGFTPAIALGGDITPDNISVFNIKEHLGFLSQLK